MQIDKMATTDFDEQLSYLDSADDPREHNVNLVNSLQKSLLVDIENLKIEIKADHVTIQMDGADSSVVQSIYDSIHPAAPKKTGSKFFADISSVEEPVSSTFDKGKLTLKGPSLKTSQIKPFFSQLEGIKEVEIFALDTVTIDEDLTDPKLRGVNLIVIAPKWEVVGDRIFDLSGKECEFTYPRPAPQGSDLGLPGVNGDPGYPGHNGGHFLGIGETISSLQHLTVIANGGKGGPGQQGGMGYPGAMGESGTRETRNLLFNEFLMLLRGHSLIEPIRPQVLPTSFQKIYWEEYVVATPVIGSIDHVKCKNYGKAGHAGGAGGQGGEGGFGGRNGTAMFINLDPKGDILHSILNDGQPGSDGEAGYGAMGGYNGWNWSGVYSYQQDRWIQGPISEKDPPVLDGKIRGDLGARPTEKNNKGIKKPDDLILFNVPSKLVDYKEYLAECLDEGIEVRLALDFCAHWEGNQEVQKLTTLRDLIDECDRSEDLYSKVKNKTALLPIYESLLRRLSSYVLLSGELPLHLQILHDTVASKINLLRAASGPWLVIDIQTFIRSVVKSVDRVNALKKNDMINLYKDQYEETIKIKIKEAESFVQKLSEDVEVANQEINDQILILLDEIKTLEANAEVQKEQLVEKKKALEELMKTKAIFGVLNLAIAGIGCNLPPFGPIVAGIVNVALDVIADPGTASGKLGALETYANQFSDLDSKPPAAATKAQNELWKQALPRLKGFANAARPLVGVVTDLLKDKDQIDAINDEIKKTDEQIASLRKYEETVRDPIFGNSLHQFVAEAGFLQKELAARSLIGREYGRLQVKRVFEDIQDKIKAFTKGFHSGEGFERIIRQIEESIDTSMNIYDHVQDYADRIELIEYMADLSTSGSGTGNPQLDSWVTKTKENILLERYCQATSAVRQWSFPFAANFLTPFVDLNQFTQLASHDEMVKLVSARLIELQEKVNLYFSGVARMDESIVIAYFRRVPASSPFFVWDGQQFRGEIEKLLRGEAIILEADLSGLPSYYSAVKFNQVGIKISCKGDEALQKRLDQELEKFKIKMTHSGNSIYRFNGNRYLLPNDSGFLLFYSFGKTEGVQTNESNAYEKMKNGDLMVSPYTKWMVQIFTDEGTNDLLSMFGNDLSNFELQLVGHGTYVDERMIQTSVILDPFYSEQLVK